MQFNYYTAVIVVRLETNVNDIEKKSKLRYKEHKKALDFHVSCIRLKNK
jgi:hypothetical protein